MENVTDDMKITDIQRVAHLLNTSRLSLEEYVGNGGKYSADVIDDEDSGGFSNLCALAGIKRKFEK